MQFSDDSVKSGNEIRVRKPADKGFFLLGTLFLLVLLSLSNLALSAWFIAHFESRQDVAQQSISEIRTVLERHQEVEFTPGRVIETRVVNHFSCIDDLAKVDDVSSLPRLVPHLGPDGLIDGYRISGIRRDSLAETYGLSNGDVLYSFNGIPTISTDAWQTIHESIYECESSYLELMRQGERGIIVYIVP